MNDIIKECNEKTKIRHIGYRYLKSVEIANGAFADDLHSSD